MGIGYNILFKLVKPFVGSGIGNNKLVAKFYQWLFARLAPKDILVEILPSVMAGIAMQVFNKGHIGDIVTELLFKGVHEPTTTKVFNKILKAGDSVIDVGANIGYFTLLASKIVGWRGMVYAFEPSADNVRELYKNLELNKAENVRVYRLAIGDTNGNITLYTSSKESARHSLIRTNEHDGNETVQIIPLDKLMIDKVRLLKSDTEGNELAVLKGAKDTILRNKNIVLIVEINKDMLDACGIAIDTLWNYIISTLNMTYVYLINDYNDSIECIYSPSMQTWDWKKRLGVKKYGYNLLCSREGLKLG